jgi:oligopeptide/dipeptide ABC transporter ATP-binding protein
MDAILHAQNLTISYRTGDRAETPAVVGVTFHLHPGEAVGLLGESGCGKTTTALSLPCLLPRSARVIRGRILFQGRDLLQLSRRDMDKIRGREISMIFQEPSISLNPVICVGDQIAEIIRVHRSWGRRRCRAAAEALLSQVRLQDVVRVYKAYPNELSGGQNQRILIAQALACEPSVVIADEPTTGLDTETQAEILDLLRELKMKSRTAFLFISHHPGVLARLVDRVLIMYAGRIVEEGDLLEVYRSPMHPYTQGLLRSMPRKPAEDGERVKERLAPISGSPADMNALATGCPFVPRCPVRMDVCGLHEPQFTVLDGNRRVRCFAYGN